MTVAAAPRQTRPPPPELEAVLRPAALHAVIADMLLLASAADTLCAVAQTARTMTMTSHSHATPLYEQTRPSIIIS